MNKRKFILRSFRLVEAQAYQKFMESETFDLGSFQGVKFCHKKQKNADPSLQNDRHRDTCTYIFLYIHFKKLQMVKNTRKWIVIATN